MAGLRKRIKDLNQASSITGQEYGVSDNGSIVQKFKITDAVDSMTHVVNVLNTYQADNTGATDTTTQFSNAVTACPTKGVVYVPEGIYQLNNLQVGKDVSFRLHPNAVLIHKANATAPMIKYTVPASGFFEGGIIDGNGANQACTGTADVNSWFACLQTSTSSAFTVRDTTFQNFCLAGLRDNASTGRLRVSRCNFLNGRQHTNGAVTGIVGFQSSGINVLVSTQDARPHVSVTDCNFVQDATPTNLGGNPGGLIIAGHRDTNCFVSVKIHGNFFYQTGQVYAGNNLGSVDLYEDCLNAVVSDNIIRAPLYIGLKLQNLTNLVCTGNTLDCNSSMVNGGSGILYDPHQRLATATSTERAIISKNIVTGITVSNGVGIAIYGSVAVGKKVIVSDNTVENCLVGIDVGGSVGMTGPISIQGNTIQGGSNSALQILKTAGDVRIHGNHISGGLGLLATSGVNTANFYLSNNYIEATGGGSKACIIWGANKIYSYSGNYINSNGAGSPGIEFKQDGSANKIAELLFPPGPNTVVGIDSTVIADILRWRGISSGTGSPEGVYAATTGDVFLRKDTSNVKYYFKNSGTGNTGWL
jgi:hypothetical protein